MEGSGIRPVLKFEHTGLPANMLHSTRDFMTPSPIQSQCWPIVMSGHDMVGIAATGSGKTLAFGLPMMRHIVAQKVGGVMGLMGRPAFGLHMERHTAVQKVCVRGGGDGGRQALPCPWCGTLRCRRCVCGERGRGGGDGFSYGAAHCGAECVRACVVALWGEVGCAALPMVRHMMALWLSALNPAPAPSGPQP